MNTAEIAGFGTGNSGSEFPLYSPLLTISTVQESCDSDTSATDRIAMARRLELLASPIEAGGSGLSNEAIAKLYGKTDTWVRIWRAVLRLPEAWQQRLARGELSHTRAMFLLPLSSEALEAVDRDYVANPTAYKSRESFNRLVKDFASKFPREVIPMPKVKRHETRVLRETVPRVKAPSYLLHKPSGQARVRIDGKDHYLGAHGSEQSLRMYDELIAAYIRGKSVDGLRMTIDELSIRFLGYAEMRYRKNDEPTTYVEGIGKALKYLVRMYGTLRAADFSPLKLKAVRQEIANSCLRNTANAYCRIITAMFEWAAAEELLSESVFRSLTTLKPLRNGEGRSNAPVGPVSLDDVFAIEKHVPFSVWGMIRLQLATAARPGEVRIMRLIDIDRTQPVWLYRPSSHKTEHRGKERLIFIGPKGQEIINSYITADTAADTYLFHIRRRPILRKPYSCCGYAKAVRRACQAVGIPEWHPNQLRHTAATVIRSRFNLETAKLILGHSNVKTTEIYAERDLRIAYTAIEEVG